MKKLNSNSKKRNLAYNGVGSGGVTPEVIEQLEEDVERARQGNHVYSTNERVCGEWIDGSNIYEKTTALESPIEIRSNAYTDITTIFPDIKLGINFMAYDTTTGENGGCKYYAGGLKSEADSTISADVIMAQYLKDE